MGKKTVQVKKLPHPAERLSCLYIQWCVQYVKSVWKKCVFAPKFLVYCGEIKGSKTFFRLILPKKIDSP